MSNEDIVIKTFKDVVEYCPYVRLSCEGCPKFDDCKVLHNVRQ